jgi:alanine racemase
MRSERAWARIDLNRLSTNLAEARSRLPEQKILAVVKADAYGHGAIAVCHQLQQDGIDYLGVGTSREAIDLRNEGIDAPILVLGALLPTELPEVIEREITVTIHSPGRISELDQLASEMGRQVKVHLLVDTGMGRLGVSHHNAGQHARQIADSPWLFLEGVGTHLASPGDADQTGLQRSLFQSFIAELNSLNVFPELIHVDASHSALGHPCDKTNMVRLGGWIYGITSHPAPSVDLRPALSLHSQIVYLRDHPEGRPIGYGGTFVTSRASRLATISIGYHDGLPTTLSNQGELLVRGHRVPVVGRVTMDYTIVDVTDVPGVSVGDLVTLLGTDGEEEISAPEMAAWCGLVPYEVTCLLGRRILRIPVSGEQEDSLTRELERGTER